MVVNNETIRSEMFKQRISGVQMAKILKISQTSFYKKINNKRPFLANEIGTIATVLNKEANFFYKSCL